MSPSADAPGILEPNSASGSTPPRGPPTFKDPYEERDYLKARLALAFRIFAKQGYDEG